MAGRRKTKSAPTSEHCHHPDEPCELPCCHSLHAAVDHKWITAVYEDRVQQRQEVKERGNIRFPRSIRELGILYVCDEVVEAKRLIQ